MLLEKISSNLNRKTDYKGKNYTYQTIFLDNIQQLASFILDKKKSSLNIPEFRIKRNDSVATRERVLSMTPEQRKQLGINKSTVWYEKKQLLAGKRIKVYRKVLSKLSSQRES